MRKLTTIIAFIILFAAPVKSIQVAADEGFEWVLVNVINYPNDEVWTQTNLHESYDHSYSCSPGNYSVTSKYVGRDEDWRNPPKKKGEGITLNGSFSKVPETMKAGEEVSINIILSATDNSLSFFTFWSSGQAYFDRPDIKPGSKSRSSLTFNNDQGESSFELEKANEYATIDETIKAIAPQGSSDGDQISIITTFYRGVPMGTSYIYEWRQVGWQPSKDSYDDETKGPLSTGGIPSIAIIGGLIGAVIIGLGGFLGIRKRKKKVEDIIGSNSRQDNKYDPKSNDGPTEYSFPDGTKQYTFPDGSIREERPDGSVVGKLADGTTFESVNNRINIFNNDGSIITSMPDGTYIERIPSNISGDQIITTYPDGTTTIVTEGNNRKITRTPDGKMKVTEPDGSTKTYNKNEEVIEVTTPEGSKAVRNSSGSFDLEFSDGTRGIADFKNETLSAKIDSINGPVEYSFNTKEMTKDIHGPDFSYKETPKELNIKTPDKSLNFKEHDSGVLEYNYNEGNNHKRMQIEKDGNTKLNIKNEDGSQVDAKMSKDGSMQIRDSQGSNINIDKSGNIEGNIKSENGSITIKDNKVKIKLNNGTEHQLKRLSDGSFTSIN
jgi:hypothetical protein